MSFAHWMKGRDGHLLTQPLTGWEMATFPMTAIARLEFVASEDQLRTGEREAVQLAMTAAQLRELSAVLLRTAQRIEAQPLGPKQ